MPFMTDAAMQKAMERKASGIVRVGITPHRHTSKPNNAGKEKNKLYNDEGTLQELAQNVVIGPNGGAKTWCPGVMVGGTKAENWTEQQVFAVDIDNEEKDKTLIQPDDPRFLSITALLARCEKYGIMPVFMYTSFSSTFNNKYRVVWALPDVTKNVYFRQAVQNALLVIFPEGDPSCKNADRIYYGGKELVYENYDARLDIGKLFDATIDCITKRDKVNAARNIKSFCQDVGLQMINGWPAINEEVLDFEDLTASSIIYNSGGGEIFKNELDCFEYQYDGYVMQFARARRINDKGQYQYDAVSNQRVGLEQVRRIDWARLAERCPVFRDFANGIDVHHNVTFMIATNLMYIEGGEEKFFECLRKRYEYDEGEWRDQFAYIRKRLYIPTSYRKIKEWYPNAEQEARASNILNAAKLKQGAINVYEQTRTKMTLAQAEQQFAAELAYALSLGNAEKQAVTVLKFPTGIGKTRAILGAENAIIAGPTHAWKRQMEKDMREAGYDVIASPEIPEGLDEDVIDAIDALYRKGAARVAAAFLRGTALIDDRVKRYVEDLDAFYSEKHSTIITTHARLLFMQPTHHTHIIIDEDIALSLLPQSMATAKDVEKTFGFVSEYGRKRTREEVALRSAYKYIMDAPEQQMHKMPDVIKLGKALKEFEHKVITSDVKSNVLGLLHCTDFVKMDDEIHYIQRHELPNKNIIILSATASKLIYSKLFGERLRFIESSGVQTLGRITQYTAYSFSRDMIAKDVRENESKKIAWAKSLSKDRPVITHKSSKQYFDNVEMTFGAVSGLNDLTGKDTSVIGTPRQNEIAYTLLANALGIQVGSREELDFIPVERNGMEFRFMTYLRKPELQTLQLDLIEAELVQAVGRARVLRNNCEVLVFSNYPVPGADYKDDRYERD